MPWRNQFRACALVPVLLAGCASSTIDLAPEAPDRPWRPATDATGAVMPGRPVSTGANTGSSWAAMPG